MGSGVATVTANNAALVVGRHAAENLAPGTLLTASDLVTSYAPPTGYSIVGVAVKEGQVPASGVASGEDVEVVLTGLPGQQDSASVDSGSAGNQPNTVGGTTVLVAHATVLDAAPSPSSSGSDALDVSLLMTAGVAPAVASASAAGQVALIVVGPAS